MQSDHPHDFTDGHVSRSSTGTGTPPVDGWQRGGFVHGPRAMLVDEVPLPRDWKPTRPIADPVDHPDHYTAGGIECIDALQAAMTEEQFVGFCRGNAIKYLWRAGRKGDVVEDLRKASWYVDREIGARS